ncbi:MAG: DUF3240 family protein [Methylohalobius sp. ZOD2]
MTPLYLITLVAGPDLEEPVVDWLLRYEARYGFTSTPVHGHSSRLEGLSLAEQVAGRKRQVRFQMCVDGEEKRLLLDRLKADFPQSGIRYWVMPVLEEGEV